MSNIVKILLKKGERCYPYQISRHARKGIVHLSGITATNISNNACSIELWIGRFLSFNEYDIKPNHISKMYNSRIISELANVTYFKASADMRIRFTIDNYQPPNSKIIFGPPKFRFISKIKSYQFNDSTSIVIVRSY